MTVEVEWARMTAPELRAIAARADALAMLPVGSLEQRGPHLPVITDTGPPGKSLSAPPGWPWARAFRSLVLPGVWTGMSEHHLPFGGTISLDSPSVRDIAVLRARSRRWLRAAADRQRPRRQHRAARGHRARTRRWNTGCRSSRRRLGCWRRKRWRANRNGPGLHTPARARRPSCSRSRPRRCAGTNSMRRCGSAGAGRTARGSAASTFLRARPHYRACAAIRARPAPRKARNSSPFMSTRTRRRHSQRRAVVAARSRLARWPRSGDDGGCRDELSRIEIAVMIESISAITLATHDMPRSVRFYTALGFDILHGGEASLLHQLSCRLRLSQCHHPAERQAVVVVGPCDLLCRRRRRHVSARAGGGP